MRFLKNTSRQHALLLYSFIVIILTLLTFSHFLLKSLVVQDKIMYAELDGDDVKKRFIRHEFETTHPPNSSNQENIIPELRMTKFRFDDRQLLRIFDFQYIGNEWENLTERYKVCFSTQTSIERIYWLPSILKNWNGPLSLAVHITSNEEWLILNLFKLYLSTCHIEYLNRVSIHLAVPTNISTALTVSNATWDIIEMESKLKACPNPKEFLKYLLNTFPTTNKERLKLKEVYPQNHLRNIARKACSVPWIYSVDIDIIPSAGMAEKLQEFYDNRERDKIQCEKCAFVIPAFELKETLPFPRSKKGISTFYKNGGARYFHVKCYSGGHKATDYERWTSTNMEDGPIKISHPIKLDKGDLYEPFYISAGTIPPFDERFLGYGFTRNSQFKAAYLAGWRFPVLTPVFSVHWGFQTPETVLSPKKDGVGKTVRSQQTDANGILYTKIVRELELKQRLKTF